MNQRMHARILSTLFVIALASGPSSAWAADTTHDGSTPELAVDLSTARNEMDGMLAQKAWLDEHYPGARVKSQSLIMGRKVMDLLTLELPSGEEKDVYFDISSYFGKM